MVSLNNPRVGTIATLVYVKEAKIPGIVIVVDPKDGFGQGLEEDIWNVIDLPCSREGSPFALGRLKSLWKSFTIPFPITVAKAE